MKVPKIDSEDMRAKWARLALPLLVDQARGQHEQKQITYADLRDNLNGLPEKPAPRAPIPIGLSYVLGTIGNALVDTEKAWGTGKIPPITALVVSQSTGLPSEGADQFIAPFLGCSEDEVKNLGAEQWDDLLQQIYDFPKWDEGLDHWGLKRSDQKPAA